MEKQYKFGKLFQRFLVLINIVLTLSLLCSSVARYIDPRTFWPPAFVALAYVPLFFLNLLLFFITTLRKKMTALLPLFALILSLPVFFDTFSFRAEPKSPDNAPPGSLRLFTWNIHYFQDILERPLPESQNEMLDVIASASPDVVCLEEFYVSADDTSSGMDSLSKRLKTPFKYFRSMEDVKKGMAVFSKYPIIKTGLIAFSDAPTGNQCIYTDIRRNGKIIRIYTVHLESIRLQSNQLNYINSLAKGKEANIKPSKKIAGQLKRAFIARSEQVKLVRQDAERCPYPYLICGDFNDPPSSYAFHQMASGLKNSFAEKGHGLFPVTYYRGLLKYQIDHILASPHFTVLNHQIIRKKISDHYPVMSDLHLP